MTDAKILGDTEVYQQYNQECYRRTVVAIGWDPENPRRLAQVDMKIHRIPGDSHAKGSVWTTAGWVPVVDLPNVMFWAKMPSFIRWDSDAATSKTTWLAHEVLAKMREVAEFGDLYDA